MPEVKNKNKVRKTDRINWAPISAVQFIANGIVQRHAQLPGQLVRHTQTPDLALVPSCCTPAADTICDCGGLLAMVAAVWRHLDRCLNCNGRTGPCDRRHVSCTRPAPRQCQGRRCGNPVTVDVHPDGTPEACASCSRGD